MTETVVKATKVKPEAKKSKKRWSRQQKRESREASIETPAKRGKRRKKKAPLTPREKLLACAITAQSTESVLLVTTDDSATAEENDDFIPIFTSCLSTKSLCKADFPSPCIIAQPLLVLDLNGILCHRIRRHNIVPGTKFRDSAGHVANTPIVERTDLKAFLKKLDEHFTLAVWTSATIQTAKRLIKLLVPPQISKRFLFVWAQNRCQKLNPDAAASDVVYVKSLEKVWQLFPIWDASNTLLIDDSPEKCPIHFQANALHPPPLNGELVEEVASECGAFENGQVPSSAVALLTQTIALDAANEARQLEFFENLVEHFRNTDKARKNDTRLITFLETSGRDHMGWRGPKEQPISLKGHS